MIVLMERSYDEPSYDDLSLIVFIGTGWEVWEDEADARLKSKHITQYLPGKG